MNDSICKSRDDDAKEARKACFTIIILVETIEILLSPSRRPLAFKCRNGEKGSRQERREKGGKDDKKRRKQNSESTYRPTERPSKRANILVNLNNKEWIDPSISSDRIK